VSVTILFERHPDNPIYVRLHGILRRKGDAEKLRECVKGHETPLETARLTVQEGEHEEKA
jgi:hypothetical protein